MATSPRKEGSFTGADLWVAVTPSNSAVDNFAVIPIAIGVTGAGDVVLVDGNGNTWTCAFAAGEIKPVHPVRVNLTGTIATGIKALY